MNLELLHKLFTAIKNNDVASFSEIVATKRSILSLRFGRFPLLSVCYLFYSTNIIEKFERDLMGIVNYTEGSELNEIYIEFKKHAKKCMRFYLDKDSIVTPLEMLAIINDAYTLRNIYARYPKTLLVKERINDIYRLLHNQNIKQEDNIIYVKRQKLPKNKRAVLVAIAMIAVMFMSMFGGFYKYIDVHYGKGTEAMPIVIRREAQLVTALKTGKLHYILDKNMILTEEIVTDFDGFINGNGNTITISYNLNSSIIGTNKGTISNLNFNLGYKECELEDNFAFLINKNEGSLINVSVSVDASIYEETDKDDLYASIVCFENSGSIIDCIVYSKVKFEAKEKGNAYLSAFAAKNNGTINRCILAESSDFETDTVDIGGIATENGESGKINNCKNLGVLQQTTKSDEWNPICGGIVSTNNGLISNCINKGKVIASSQGSNANCEIYIGGIAALNNAKISKSKNTGEIAVLSKVCRIYLGGIAGVNNAESSVIESSGVDGILSIQSPSEFAFMFVGGVSGFNDGTIKDCFFIGEMDTDNQNVLMSYVVGFVARNSISNNIAFKRDNIPYLAITLNYDFFSQQYFIIPINEGSTLVDTLEEVKKNEVYWE